MSYRLSYLIVIACLVLAGAARAQEKSKNAPKDDTETVYTTFRVKDGKEAEFRQVSEKAWAAYQKHGMVLTMPHMLLRGEDDAGKVYFIEILRWKDHDKPDNAPADVTAIWAQMEALCEKRDRHRGIEFHEVQVIRK
jgi:quinol monooxygenase YgiN